MTERFRKMLMENTNFYDPNLMGETSKFGAIRGVNPGATFENRKDCSESGVHQRTVAGIAGSWREGAYSVCLSGGYEDDKDAGEFFVYTGTGGQEDSFAGSGRQVKDQTFTHRDNAALKRSAETHRPVRVVRGPNVRSKWAPARGYRYDGLYIVERAYYDKGKSGWQVCKYDLRRLPGQPSIPPNSNYKDTFKYA